MFVNWLTGNMGTAGEYMYTAIHWYALAGVILAAAVILGSAALMKNRPNARRKLLVAVAAFQLGFEVLWRLIYLLVKKDPIVGWWPMYPCNLGGILLPVFTLMDCTRGKKMFYLFGFIGGCLTFALPDGIFSNNVFVFPILKSVLQHTGLLLIPALEYISDTYRPKLQDMGYIIAGGLIHIFNCEVIDRVLGFDGDYMFLRGELPFVVPGVPQWITMTVFALIVFAVLSFLCDVKGSLAALKRTK